MHPRTKAKLEGKKRYFTGKPCKHGHVAERTLSGSCVACCEIARNTPQAVQKRAQNYIENRASRLAYSEEWKKLNPEKRKIIVARAYKNNREEKLAYNVRYRKQFPDKMQEFRDNWELRNVDRRRSNTRNRRARNRAAEGTHTKNDILRLWDLQDGLCGHCREPMLRRGRGGRSAHVDHVEPLHRGGANWPNNLQLLCGSCNDMKGRKDPREFVRQTGKMFMCWAA